MVLHPAPVFLGNDTSFCRGDSITLHAGSGFIHYLWDDGSAGESLIAKNSGNYTVTVTDPNGCRTADTLVVRQLFALPAVHLAGDSLLCADSVRVLDAGAGYRSYTWEDGTMLQTLTVSGPGLYWVQVTDSNGCVGGDTSKITGFDPAPAQFLGPDTAICNYAATLELQAKQAYSSYLWSTGDLSSSITIHTGGVYWLTVADVHGCPGTDSIRITVMDCLEGAYFANAFTPNNDGHNDIFRPQLFGNVENYQLRIFNRFGQLVFESAVPANGWNGNLGGRPQDPGTYVWSCSYKLSGQQQKNARGFVVLIR